MKKIFSTHYSAGAFNFATLLLRLAFGGTMIMAHGLDKVQNSDKYLGMFKDPFGVNDTASFWLVVFAEFLCALFVVLGLFTRLACIPLIIAMAVAFFYAHKSNLGEGWAAFSYMMAFIILLLTGPGKLSIDAAINKR